jgi:hypothetical protein
VTRFRLPRFEGTDQRTLDQLHDEAVKRLVERFRRQLPTPPADTDLREQDTQ